MKRVAYLAMALGAGVLAACGRSGPPPATTGDADTDADADADTDADADADADGDADADTDTDADGDTIYDVQQGNVGEGDYVVLDGVLVAGTAEYGFYAIEPAGGPWSGVYAYYGSGWQSVTGPLTAGDEITLEGTVTEYEGTTEVDFYAGNVEVTGTGSLPAPTVVPAADLAAETTAEPYESCLVRVDAATVTDVNPDAPSNYGEFAIDDGVRVDDLWYDAVAAVGGITVGDTFEYVAGLFRYEYGDFHLTPRDAGDVGDYSGGGTGPGPDATIYEVQQTMSDGDPVTVSGVVVTATGPYGFWVQEPAGGEYSGVYVYGGSGWEKSHGPVSIGDEVDVDGAVSEWDGLTEIDLWGGSVTVVGTAPVPAPQTVTTADLADPKIAETWESVLIIVMAPRVTDANPDGPKYDYGEFAIQDGVRVDDLMYDVEADIGPLSPGTSWTSLTGLCYFSYGFFKIEPRYAGDFAG